MKCPDPQDLPNKHDTNHNPSDPWPCLATVERLQPNLLRSHTQTTPSNVANGTTTRPLRLPAMTTTIEPTQNNPSEACFPYG